MTANKMLAKMEKRIANLFAQRSALFTGDCRAYDVKHRELRQARAERQNFIDWCWKHEIDMSAELPQAPQGYGYTRFETLPEGHNVARIWINNKWLYARQGAGLAANLKDCV